MLAMIEQLDRTKVKPFAAVSAEGELSNLLQQLDCPTFIVPFAELRRSYFWKRWLLEARRFFNNIPLLRSLIREHNLQVLHVDEERDAVACGYAKKHTSAKRIFHARLTSPSKFDHLIERAADAIIGVSDGASARLPQFPSAKKRTIFDGIDFFASNLSMINFRYDTHYHYRLTDSFCSLLDKSKPAKVFLIF